MLGHSSRMAETQRTSIKRPSKNPQTSSAHPQRTGQFLATNTPAENVMQLQRTLGNQAVQGLFASGAIQAKLKIGQPNDKYEQEAERVSDAVMRMPEESGIGGQNRTVRRKPT